MTRWRVVLSFIVALCCVGGILLMDSMTIVFQEDGNRGESQWSMTVISTFAPTTSPTSSPTSSLTPLTTLSPTSRLPVVAIVGNGPVSHSQRLDLKSQDKFDVVVRFNKLNFYEEGERFDVHVIRSNVRSFWGIKEAKKHPEMPMIVLGTTDRNRPELRTFEDVTFIDPMTDRSQNNADYAVFNLPLTTIQSAEYGPSTGLIIISYYASISSSIDLYGFNWDKKSLHVHLQNEEKIIRDNCKICTIHDVI